MAASPWAYRAISLCWACLKISLFVNPDYQKEILTYLGGKIAAGFEFLQSQGHGVSPKEKDEGHECQVWDKLAGAPKQAPAVAQTFLLAQQGPVQRCEVKGGVLGDQAQKKRGQDPPTRPCVLLPVVITPPTKPPRVPSPPAQ